MFFTTLSTWSLLAIWLLCIDSVISQNHFAITGVKTGVNAQTGYRHREKISLIFKKISLYVQALNKVMNTPETELLSYFQVAGIHGLPHISWDNVNPRTPAEGINTTGYCPHGSPLFTSWHRPYLVLLEQIVAGHAQTIAKTYPPAIRPIYQTAADNLRQPYWDWAKVPQQIPDVMTTPTVKITTAKGVENVANPLFQYKFLNHPEPTKWFPSDSFLGSLPNTVRYPDENNQSRNAVINGALAEDGPFLINDVWNTFAISTTYNVASTVNNPGSRPSFEGPHNTMHLLVGGNGHFAPVDFAAFDPVFWLHHATVDRFLTMWQAIYPNSWMEPARSSGGTWTLIPGSTVDGNTPLTPFTRSDKTRPYTTNTVRFVKDFGYSYPEVQDWLPRTPAQLAANVTAAVNKLYNPDGAFGTFPPPSMRIRDPTKRDTRRQWSVKVGVPNKAIDGAFFVKVSVGDVGIGKMGVLALTQEAIDAGSNPTTSDQYTLTRGLKDVDSQNVDAVLSLLKGSLKWTVTKAADGSVVPNSQVEGLVVTVQDEIVTQARDITEFPVYGETTLHPDVTA